jgi:FMN phosphatase YigB (HAD superfamily)
MTITHIFFDLHGVLADSAKVHICYSAGLGRILSKRYGGVPDAWARANRTIVADWDSYFVDLDLEGEDGLADMWEGIYRTTRALFRLVGVPEPHHTEILELSRELPGLVVEGCDALFPEVRDVLKQLRAAGYILGTASNAILPQVRSTLAGGGILDEFQGPLMAADVAEQWAKDEQYYRLVALRADADPDQCLVIDDQLAPLQGARDAGLCTAWLDRKKLGKRAPVDVLLIGDLTTLPTRMKDL